MVYGSEVISSSELQYKSPRVLVYQLVEVERARHDAIDLLEDSRDITIMRSARN
jgi:hypothetical protein